ncbi:MAG: sporulation protein YqfC [Firmicutes bacterium]|nr:sporulation protein YqfC [Bacillota bacterium]
MTGEHGRGRRLLEKTAAALELPPEVALDEVKLALVGGRELWAVNHRGILIYESGRIVFRCRGGAVTVSGRGLRLSELNGERLRIAGRLTGLLLPAGEGGADES